MRGILSFKIGLFDPHNDRGFLLPLYENIFDLAFSLFLRSWKSFSEKSLRRKPLINNFLEEGKGLVLKRPR